jgi:hypothetical protein
MSRPTSSGSAVDPSPALSTARRRFLGIGYGPFALRPECGNFPENFISVTLRCQLQKVNESKTPASAAPGAPRFSCLSWALRSPCLSMSSVLSSCHMAHSLHRPGERRRAYRVPSLPPSWIAVTGSPACAAAPSRGATDTPSAARPFQGQPIPSHAAFCAAAPNLAASPLPQAGQGCHDRSLGRNADRELSRWWIEGYSASDHGGGRCGCAIFMVAANVALQISLARREARGSFGRWHLDRSCRRKLDG